MKSLLAAALALAFSVMHVQAQQRPQYTQYILNSYIINPAVAGIENYIDVKLSHRHQWVGINGAPVTSYVTIHGPLQRSDYDKQTITSTHMSGENPRGRNYWSEYEAPEAHGGVGLTVINDRTGPMNRFSGYGTLTYHIGLSPKTNLSGGFSAGFQQLRLNAGKLDFGEQYPIDPSVSGSAYVNRLRPDFNAGLWLYSARYFAGVSAMNIIPQGVGFNNGAINGDRVTLLSGKQLPHLFVTGGYMMFLTEQISLLPSAMVKWISPTPVSVDVNAKLQWQDVIWTGINYRFKDGFGAMVGMNINPSVNISYSYDYITSKLNNVSSGTHEILIGFALGNSYGDWCPRNIW